MSDETLRFDEKSLSWKEIDGEVVALDLARGTYFSINASGVTLFRALVEGTTRATIVAARCWLFSAWATTSSATSPTPTWLSSPMSCWIDTAHPAASTRCPEASSRPTQDRSTRS